MQEQEGGRAVQETVMQLKMAERLKRGEIGFEVTASRHTPGSVEFALRDGWTRAGVRLTQADVRALIQLLADAAAEAQLAAIAPAV